MVIIVLAATILFKPDFKAGDTEVSPAVDFAKGVTRVALVLTVAVIVILFFTIYYGVRVTHRIVGPIVAFNRHLNYISEGNYSRDLTLREKDEFKSLALVFNKTQGVLKRRAEQNIETGLKAQQNLEDLGKILKTTDFNKEDALGMIGGLKDGLGDLCRENEKLVEKR